MSGGASTSLLTCPLVLELGGWGRGGQGKKTPQCNNFELVPGRRAVEERWRQGSEQTPSTTTFSPVEWVWRSEEGVLTALRF